MAHRNPHTALVSVEELAAHLDEWVLVDTRFNLMDVDRGRADYLGGHLPGAVYAHLDEDLSGPPLTDRGRHPLPSPEAMEAAFGRLGIAAGVQVVAYDYADGSTAGRLWWMLRYMGHDAVAVLDGGWKAWEAAGRPVQRGEVRRDAVEFRGEARREWLVTVDAVTEARLLVDARDPGRFRGEHEPIDPVAGHVPGAVNRFFRANLDHSGRFLSPQALSASFAETFGEVPPQDTVHYCGSGVTACHNLLAMAHAGLAPGRLYVGSWSEWSADPGRPVATGD
jgi:thiosulfate/3-mercaptopyruvate sulfurtransferase